MKWTFIFKTASQPINLDPLEERIFSFLKEVAMACPNQPVVRISGGWIRDKMLGQKSNDLDINVDTMKGLDFANFVRQYAIQKYGINQTIISEIKDTEARPEQIKNLAVAILNIHGQKVEMLSARAIEYYRPGDRNPVTVGWEELNAELRNGPNGIVEFIGRERPDLLRVIEHFLPPDKRNDPREVLSLLDAHRRDLTINCMSYNILSGETEDKTQRGVEDLHSKMLRTPLEPIKTFEDDPLRVLRVLRFFSRYQGSQIAPEAIEAMKNPNVQHQLTRRIINPKDEQGIVVERTAEELRKLMSGDQPEKALQIMYETGLLAKMLNLPPTFNPLNMDQKSKWHQLTVIEHTLEVLKNVNKLCKEHGLTDNERMMMNISALFHDLGKLDPRSHKNKIDGTRGYSGNPEDPTGIPHETSSADQWGAFSKALQFTNDETKWINDVISGHMRPHSHIEDKHKTDVSDKSMRRYMRLNPNWMFQYIHAWADAMSKSETPDPEIGNAYRQNIDRLKHLTPAQNMGKSKALLNGNEIYEITKLPHEPFNGLPSPTKVIQERILQEQDGNPDLTPEQAKEIVRNMLISGELDGYKRAITWFKRIKHANNNNRH